MIEPVCLQEDMTVAQLAAIMMLPVFPKPGEPTRVRQTAAALMVLHHAPTHMCNVTQCMHAQHLTGLVAVLTMQNREARRGPRAGCMTRRGRVRHWRAAGWPSWVRRG